MFGRQSNIYIKGLPVYSVIWKIGNDIIKQDEVEYMETSSTPNYNPPEGYIFLGWDGNGQNITSNRTITGSIKIKEFTVTWMINGITIKTETVKWGHSAIPPTQSLSEGIFPQYNIDSWDKDYSSIKSDTIINANVSIKTFTVTFINNNNSQTLKVQTDIPYGGTATPPDVSNIEGYTFKSWSRDFSNIISDTIIYAYFDVVTFTVKFYDDGIVKKTQQVDYGASATPPYITKEWCTLSWSADYTNVRSNLDIYAIWTEEEAEPITCEQWILDAFWPNIWKTSLRESNIDDNLGEWFNESNTEDREAKYKVYEANVFTQPVKNGSRVVIKTAVVEYAVLSGQYLGSYVCGEQTNRFLFKSGDKIINSEIKIEGEWIKNGLRVGRITNDKFGEYYEIDIVRPPEGRTLESTHTVTFRYKNQRFTLVIEHSMGNWMVPMMRYSWPSSSSTDWEFKLNYNKRATDLHIGVISYGEDPNNHGIIHARMLPGQAYESRTSTTLGDNAIIRSVKEVKDNVYLWYNGSDPDGYWANQIRGSNVGSNPSGIKYFFSPGGNDGTNRSFEIRVTDNYGTLVYIKEIEVMLTNGKTLSNCKHIDNTDSY